MVGYNALPPAVKETPSDVRRDIGRDRVFLVGTDQGSVGSFRLRFRSDTAFLYRFGVVPEARGRGIGSWMLKHVIDYCRPRGIVLETNVRAAPAIYLYTKHGFTVTNKYVDQDANRVYVMQKEMSYKEG